MDRAIIVRAMLKSDLDFAAGCTAQEAWTTELRTEFEGFYGHDPEGCLIAEVDGQRAGICVATPYDRAGFIGELIVAQAWRGRGIGRRLMERAMGHLHGRGVQTVFLDGVPLAVPLYERLGFRKIARSLRFVGTMSGSAHRDVRPMKVQDLPAVLELDREAFGADRGFFLRRRRYLYPELSKVLECRGKVVGFILGRRGPDWATAGPWVVGFGAEDPVHLLQSFALEVEGITTGVGVLETNTAAVQLLASSGLAERPACPWRMVSGSEGHVSTSNQLYAIGSAAKG